ncbi:sensor histidine kinase [Saccharibacillus sp. CPCC 101409]|uniref:sensor histidine kinase n=1 Tax=Saccharibacillus sp. CPCC 101409 TaxID=3058041 RepID=UPI0026728597|nr:sensor histidine kinase [Saccharibacillus sp. CPCC 101409]MDO3412317.1 sensor histidine kinase [Saccharibacillus sp. CPCC 101409]
MTRKKFFRPRLDDMPLKRKFLLVYALCVLLPIMSINLFFYYRTSADIQIRERENLRRSVERAGGELLGMVDESIALSRSIAADDSLYAAMDRTYRSPSDYYSVYDDSLRDKLTRYMSANIVDVSVYTDNQSLQNGSNYRVIGPGSAEPAWLNALKASASPIALTAYRDEESYKPGRRISIAGKMDVYSSYSAYAKYSRVDLDLGRISAILNREKGSVKFRLVDDRDRVVADGLGGRDGEGGFYANPPFTPQEQKSGLFLERPLGGPNYVKGWKLTGIADTRYIDALMRESLQSILALGIVSTILPSLLIFFIFRSYHARTKQLSRHMEQVRSERFEPIDIPEGKDEIGGLIRAFNLMTGRIRSLIDDVYKLEIRQKNLELDRVRTELAMLQSQVNPHFLFNTLNAVLVVCTKNGYREITTIVKNLSLLMRQLLNRPDDRVPLEEELQFIRMYLEIEKFRFGDRFDYVFEIDPEAGQARIPRMSLQPLVENACKHGLQGRKNGRLITISARLGGEGLQLLVRDNGVGMNAERLRQVKLRMRSEAPSGESSVGLRNVHRRLELFYRSEARLIIRSREGEGTEAGFLIPAVWLNGEQAESDSWGRREHV